MQKVPLLGAVGPLQFEVVQYRLQDEYGAESRLEQTNWKVLRWVSPAVTLEQQNEIMLPAGAVWAFDTEERRVILFTSEWSMNYFREKNPDAELSDIPFKEELVILK
jgi:peptide chain release factor 3